MMSSRSISSGPGRRTGGLSSSSVYGGAGGAGVRLSSSSALGSGVPLSNALDLTADGKGTMQNLNDRLASYLQKVRSLEKANADLETKIRNFLETETSFLLHDSSAHRVTIAALQDKIAAAVSVNSSLFLSLGNSSLAADDFRAKHEAELSLRQSAEADAAGLKRVLDGLTLARSDLEVQVEGLRDDLLQMKRQHEEDLALLRGQMGGSVSVEVDAAPQEDLGAVLSGIRAHYESVANKNRKDLEAWFQAKSAELNQDVAVSTETLKTSRSEVSELRRTLETLQIKLQAHVSRKGALQANLAEVNSRYATMLAGFQRQVSSLEQQLSALRDDLANQKEEYNRLLDIKTKLELEIAEYRRLLDGETQAPVLKTKVIAVVQDVDERGNVIS